MRLLIQLILGVYGQYQNPDDSSVPSVPREYLAKYGDVSFEKFAEFYPKLKEEMGWKSLHGHWILEDFRIYKRDCFNFGSCSRNQVMETRNGRA